MQGLQAIEHGQVPWVCQGMRWEAWSAIEAPTGCRICMVPREPLTSTRRRTCRSPCRRVGRRWSLPSASCKLRRQVVVWEIMTSARWTMALIDCFSDDAISELRCPAGTPPQSSRPTAVGRLNESLRSKTRSASRERRREAQHRPRCNNDVFMQLTVQGSEASRGLIILCASEEVGIISTSLHGHAPGALLDQRAWGGVNFFEPSLELRAASRRGVHRERGT